MRRREWVSWTGQSTSRPTTIEKCAGFSLVELWDNQSSPGIVWATLEITGLQHPKVRYLQMNRDVITHPTAAQSVVMKAGFQACAWLVSQDCREWKIVVARYRTPNFRPQQRTPTQTGLRALIQPPRTRCRRHHLRRSPDHPNCPSSHRPLPPRTRLRTKGTEIHYHRPRQRTNKPHILQPDTTGRQHQSQKTAVMEEVVLGTLLIDFALRCRVGEKRGVDCR